MDPMREIMEQCMGAMGGGMMGGGAMGVMLLVAAFLLFVWILGLVSLGALGVWGFRRLSGSTGGR
jgi:predicted lipid-binding transport protein (Tim44 family)